MNVLYESYTRRNKSLIGQRFGRWTVCDVDEVKHGRMHWVCLCDCGVFGSVETNELKSGHVRSCGCLRSDTVRKRSTTHGATKNSTPSKEYTVWISAKSRCYDLNNKEWSRYGGRGITMCAEWRNSFATFLKDIGPSPSKAHQIDRKNNDGNYEPGNCRWATMREQLANKSTNLHITVFGITKTVQEWSRETGIHRNTLILRFKSGWSEGRMLETPRRHSQ